MHIEIKQYRRLKTLMLSLIIINGKIFAFGNSNGEMRSKLLRTKECTFLCEDLNLNSNIYLTYLKNLINATEQISKKRGMFLSKAINPNKANNTWKKPEGLGRANDLKNNFMYLDNWIKLTAKNTTTFLPSTACRSLINLIKNISRTIRKFQTICDPLMRTCHGKEQIKISEQLPVHCTEGKWQVDYNAPPWPNITKRRDSFKKIKKFSIVNEEPERVDISLSESVKLGKVFLWYASYANPTAPQFECRKILRGNFTVHVTPNVNYLICLAAIDKYFHVNIFDCQPYKTKPHREDQPLLVKKSMPAFIILLFVLLVLAMAIGASVLYLSIHKNPSLIRGVKRVIEVKRQDKTHILIMPRGYETVPQADSPLALSMANGALEPAMSTLSCDTNSTISYVSANQPTPVEILTYRLNRLRELYQNRSNNNANIPQLVSSVPMFFSMSLNQRLPPNVDLLLEYEWYTITTTIITTTTTTTEDE